MVYTPISNFTSGQTDIVAQLNQFRDNLKSIRLFNDHGVLLSLSDDVDIPNTTTTAITWDVINSQTGSLWTAGSPTRFTAPVTGRYAVIVNIEWRESSGGERQVGVLHSNAATQYNLESQGSLLGGGNLSAFDVIHMAATEYLVANVYQSSGGTIGIRGNGRDRTSIAVWLLGVP